jgi:hypothetical protein
MQTSEEKSELGVFAQIEFFTEQEPIGSLAPQRRLVSEETGGLSSSPLRTG